MDLLYWKFHSDKRISVHITSNVSRESILEVPSKVHNNVYFRGHLGRYSYIAHDSSLTANIGSFTSIGSFVRSTPARHAYTYPYVSTSPCFFSLYKETQCGESFATKFKFKDEVYVDEKNKIAVKIGSDCWIGDGVFLVGGIVIGDGAIVLAHAVVTKSVPPYAIVGGVPAKIIRYRYDESIIKRLIGIRWWDMDEQWLKDNWELFSNIDIFFDKIDEARGLY